MATFHHKVPRDRKKNLLYRQDLLLSCAKSHAARRMVIDACSQDILFFINALCLAKGTLVVTDRGLVPIERVTHLDKVWDGENWVSQGGAVFQGVKHVIHGYGIRLTSDHEVWTIHGWKQAGEGYASAAVRPPPGGWPSGELSQWSGSMGVPLRLREGNGGFGEQLATWETGVLRMQESRRRDDSRTLQGLDIPCLAGDAAEVFRSERGVLRSLWWTRDTCLREMGTLRVFLGGHGGTPGGNDDRANRQRRPLRAGQLSLGYPSRAGEQHPEESNSGYMPWADDNLSDRQRGGGNSRGDSLQDSAWCDRGGVVLGCDSSWARVYDLINCGPNQAFTVMGHDGPILVHNCLLYEPRPKVDKGKRLPMVIPFITWPHQEDAIREIDEHLGFEDIGVEKSRGEGMSWIGTVFALRDWLFRPGSKVGLVSRTEDMADDPEDPDSIFWKIDWQLSKLPKWLAGVKGKDWKRILDRHTLTNYRNDSRIVADAATGAVFRGGRLTWAMMDEFAFFKKGEDVDALNSSHGATNSRLFVSTVNGTSNEFHRIMHEDSSMVKVVIDWKQNISRNRGLYRMVDGVPQAVDPKKNPLPKHYSPPSPQVLALFARLRKRGFILEDGERSPWYDHECDRPGATPQRIAQELDRDYAGTEYLVFGKAFVAKVEKSVDSPTHVGNVMVEENTDEGHSEFKAAFQEVSDGPVKLWCPIDIHGRPPRGNYAFGGDVSTGQGGDFTSNSTLIGVNLDTQEQVFEFAASTMEPDAFAELSYAVAKWFWDAYLGWEHNGPGSAFTKRIIDLGYGNIYRRRSLARNSRKVTREVGWWTDDRSKAVMFAEINRAVRSGEVIIRSDELLKEFRQYVYVNGRIEHAKSLVTEHGGSKGRAHGDRVIGLGVALQCALDRPVWTGLAAKEQREAKPGTMAYRMRIQEEEERREQEGGDGWYDSVTESVCR